MLKILLARLQQKHRTIAYPAAPPPPLPDRFRGRLVLDSSRCNSSCKACTEACPTGALEITDRVMIDLGKCIFCSSCVDSCASGALSHAKEYALATRTRADLLIDAAQQELHLATQLDKKMKQLFGRSLRLRQVSAGGCNACEMDTNVLTTVGWDLSRFGISFVASPRHADGLLVTGPVSHNMALALQKTYDAVPAPKLVIAVGACALSGGMFYDHQEVNKGADTSLKVDLYIPGCPPHPLTILDGLLRLLGRV